MPAPEQDYRFQKAQLWQRKGDDAYGNPIIGERQELTVRWEDKQLEMIDPQGQPIRVDALVVHVCDFPFSAVTAYFLKSSSPVSMCARLPFLAVLNMPGGRNTRGN